MTVYNGCMTTDFRSGYVAIVGKPNVGKSTLLNRYLGQKVAAVSPRPQTTRRRQLGILTSEQSQLIFIDTPGMHQPKYALGKFMNDEATTALLDADVVVCLVDASQPPDSDDRLLTERIAALQPSPPMILALNKVDLVKAEDMERRRAEYQALLPAAWLLPLSAQNGLGCNRLLAAILERIPPGPVFFDADQVTDFFERDIAADLVREAALYHLREEVPHGIAVRVDGYTERGDTGAEIAMTIFVERESHKGIVIGKGGLMLKKIGTAARQEIEAMSGRKVFLELRVKVEADWRNKPNSLRQFGYFQEED